MKIPGLTFIIVPIIIYLIYLYFPDIVCFFSEADGESILKFILFFTFFNAILIIILGISGVENSDPEILFDKYLYVWVISKIMFKILIYINEKLTIKL
jgi:hypothetical protein